MDFRLSRAQAAFQEEVTAVADELAAPGGPDLRADPEYNEQVRMELAKRKWLAMPWPKDVYDKLQAIK